MCHYITPQAVTTFLLCYVYQMFTLLCVIVAVFKICVVYPASDNLQRLIEIGKSDSSPRPRNVPIPDVLFVCSVIDSSNNFSRVPGTLRDRNIVYLAASVSVIMVVIVDGGRCSARQFASGSGLAVCPIRPRLDSAGLPSRTSRDFVVRCSLSFYVR